MQITKNMYKICQEKQLKSINNIYLTIKIDVNIDNLTIVLLQRNLVLKMLSNLRYYNGFTSTSAIQPEAVVPTSHLSYHIEPPNW